MNIPQNVRISIALTELLNRNKQKLASTVVSAIEEYIKKEEFDLAEKRLLKNNLLTPPEIHSLIKHYFNLQKTSA